MIIRRLTLCLALMLILPLFSCKKGELLPAPPALTAAHTPAPTEAPTPEQTMEPTPDPAAQRDEKVERLVLEYSELIKSSILEQTEQLAELGMEIDVFAEGKDLICEYATSLVFTAVQRGALEQSLESHGAIFKQEYYQLAAYTGDDSVRLIVRYIDGTGSKILD